MKDNTGISSHLISFLNDVTFYSLEYIIYSGFPLLQGSGAGHIVKTAMKSENLLRNMAQMYWFNSQVTWCMLKCDSTVQKWKIKERLWWSLMWEKEKVKGWKKFKCVWTNSSGSSRTRFPSSVPDNKHSTVLSNSDQVSVYSCFWVHSEGLRMWAWYLLASLKFQKPNDPEAQMLKEITTSEFQGGGFRPWWISKCNIQMKDSISCVSGLKFLQSKDSKWERNKKEATSAVSNTVVDLVQQM